jgi:hypothetical protein
MGNIFILMFYVIVGSECGVECDLECELSSSSEVTRTIYHLTRPNLDDTTMNLIYFI